MTWGRWETVHDSRSARTAPGQCFGRRHAGRGLEGASKRSWTTARRGISGTHQAVYINRDKNLRCSIDAGRGAASTHVLAGRGNAWRAQFKRRCGVTTLRSTASDVEHEPKTDDGGIRRRDDRRGRGGAAIQHFSLQLSRRWKLLALCPIGQSGWAQTFEYSRYRDTFRYNCRYN